MEQQSIVNHSSSTVLPSLHTVEAAAAQLSLSRSNLYELIRAGKVHAVKLGARGIRVSTSELARIAMEGLE